MPGDKWTCLRSMCHLQEAVQQLLTSLCFAWLGSTLFPSTLPEAVQTMEWAGRASQAKYSRRHPVGTSQAQHSWSGRVGIHAPAWLLSPAWCSAPSQGARKRALNAVEKLPAVGNNVSGKCSSSGEVLGCPCTVVRPGAEFQLLLLPLQTAHCKPSACDVLCLMEELGVYPSALRLHK